MKGLLDRWDLKVETVKSGALKDAGNPFSEMSAEERGYWQSLIDRVYAAGAHDDIDYSKPIDPPLEDDDTAWAVELLRKAGKR